MSNQYYDMGFKGPRKNCDICGLPYSKEDLVLLNGKWVCYLCEDEPEEGVKP